MFGKLRKPDDLVMLLLLLAVFLGGCGTTKVFTVDTNPKGSLVTTKQIPKDESDILAKIYGTKYHGESPSKAQIIFLEGDRFSVTAEKRGYEPASIEVNKDSEIALSFELKRIQGVSEEPFRRESLETGSFTLLPVFAEVSVRSGVGRTGSREYSAELSKKIADSLNAELTNLLRDGKKPMRRPCQQEEKYSREWSVCTRELNEYLFTLDPARLAYYGMPPFVKGKVAGFEQLVDRLEQIGTKNPYLLYVHAKCITETTGRKVGNFFASILGAGMAGTGSMPYYDPTAFNPDSGTLVTLYVLDSKTTEVLHIEQRVFDDITDEEYLKAMAANIGAFPKIEEKKE